MSEESQKLLDLDNLEEARHNLNEFTGKIKRRYEREIHMTDMENIDEVQYGFIKENPEISFETIEWIKKFCNYMRGN